MARYRALTDLYMPSGDYIQAGTEFDAPADWRCPTHAVDPIGAEAMEAYWQERPRLSDVEPWRAVFTNGQRWSDVRVSGATTYWIKVPGGYVLKGQEARGVQPPNGMNGG